MAIGGSALANQIIINVLAIVLNYSLYTYKGESGIALYGIIYRIYMLFLVPVIGVSAGFTPVVGYNYGAKLVGRVKASIKISIQYTTLICVLLLVMVVLFSNTIVSWFTTDAYLIEETPKAMAIILALAPTLPLQFIAIAYFQAIGKPKNSIVLLVGKYVVLLIPALLFLPKYMAWEGITYAFPIVDAIISVLAFWLLKRAYKDLEIMIKT
jgi:Na+-driven multidrug efflux pump